MTSQDPPRALLPFQPATMTAAQLAAVSFLARDSGPTHHRYAYQLRPSHIRVLVVDLHHADNRELIHRPNL
jgi:hypothetical protein